MNKINHYRFHNTINKKNIILFMYFFCIIFGSKFGLVDITSIISISGIIYALINKKTYLNRETFILLILIIAIFGITLVTTIYNHNFEIFSAFRYMRAGLSLISISLVVQNSKISTDNINNTLINVLFIHATIVIIGALFPDFQNFVSNYTGYSKKFMYGRSTGLTIGFDIAGLLVVLGFLSTVILRVITDKKQTFRLITFALAALLTTRFTMLLLIPTLFFGFFIFKKYRCKFETVITLSTLIISATIALTLISSSIYFNGSIDKVFNTLNIESNFVSSIIDSYAVTDYSSVINHHYDFSNLKNIYIGDGYSPTVDPGYTLTIFYIGGLGLFLTLVFYIYIIYFALRKKRIYSSGYKSVFHHLIIIWALLIIFLSLKNNYFFTRSINETGFIIINIYFLYIKRNGRDLSLVKQSRV